MTSSSAVAIGPVHIVCPACQAVVPIPVAAELGTDDDGRPMLICTPDMADLWAHAWTHEEDPT